MARYSEKDTVLILIFIFILIFIIGYFINVTVPFLEKRKYLKMELKRAATAKEYNYWKEKLIKHYILNIPLIGKLLVKLFF